MSAIPEYGRSPEVKVEVVPVSSGNQVMSAEGFMSSQASADTNSTLVFVIGAQKAGTTWLYAQLEKCAEAYLANPKELHYWDVVRPPYLTSFMKTTKERMAVPKSGDSLKYRLSVIWNEELRKKAAAEKRYLEVYRAPPFDHSKYLEYLGVGRRGVRLVADVTPSYALLGRSTFSEMLNCHDDVRFVFIMRDPVKRLWSGIQQRFRAKPRDGSMNHADLERLFVLASAAPEDPDRRRSNYPATMEELESVIPMNRIHYCFFEKLFDNDCGACERRKLADFVGIDAELLDPSTRIHQTRRRLEPSQHTTQVVRENLDPIYQFIFERFGDDSPKAWWMKRSDFLG